jgi:hypothetical protein
MTLNFEKLKAAIHYICEKAASREDRFDHIKLNKVLWYSDAYTFLAHGDSITGATYIRKPFGPVAKHNRSAIGVLEREEKIRHGKAMPGEANAYWTDCYDVLEEADKSLFQGYELKIIDEVFKQVTETTSFDISERTHGEIWQLAINDEEIPLYTVFAEQVGEITEQHLALAAAAGR